MWSWEHMKSHRQLCDNYKNLYKTKLLSSSHSPELLADIEVLIYAELIVNSVLCACCSMALSSISESDDDDHAPVILRTVE